MPNIREQRIDENGIYIVASDGRSVTLTPEDIKRLANERLPDKAAARSRVAKAIEDALGTEQVPMRVRRVPMKPNPEYPDIKDETDIRSRERIPDHDNAYDEDTILIDFDENTGRPLSLEMRS